MSASYASMVSELVGKGVPRLKAEASARAAHPDVAHELDVATAKRSDIAEKREQSVIVKMARVIGIHVYSTSQARAAKVTPGIPDLILAHRDRGFFGFWESKRQVGGQLSAAQREFADECFAGRVPWGSGDRYEFARWLKSNGFTPPPPPQD